MYSINASSHHGILLSAIRRNIDKTHKFKHCNGRYIFETLDDFKHTSELLYNVLDGNALTPVIANSIPEEILRSDDTIIKCVYLRPMDKQFDVDSPTDPVNAMSRISNGYNAIRGLFLVDNTTLDYLDAELDADEQKLTDHKEIPVGSLIMCDNKVGRLLDVAYTANGKVLKYIVMQDGAKKFKAPSTVQLIRAPK